MAVKKDTYTDRGVMPDYPVYLTIKDVTEHTDSQIDYALKLIEK
jgi:hypothetical protein